MNVLRARRWLKERTRGRFDGRSGTLRVLSSIRRRWLLHRIRWRAWLVRSTVDARIAPDVIVSRGVRVEIGPRTHSVLRVGPGGRLGAGAFFELKGGVLEFGSAVDIRHATRFNVAGYLSVSGPTIFGEYSTIHCSTEVLIGPFTSFSERVVVTDSSHYHEAPDAWFYHSVKPGSVRFGRNSWVAAGATVTRNTRLGDWCIVGANSVVVSDVPDGCFATGVPATVAPLGYSWVHGVQEGSE